MRSPIEIYHNLRDNLRTVEALKNSERLPYSAEILQGDDILQARQMLARVYVDKGVVSEEDLTDDGTLNDEKDPYWPHSVYYGVKDERDPSRLLIASRLVVVPPGETAEDSLQLHFDDIDPLVADQLRAQDPSTIAEFAAYIKAEGLDPVESRIASMYLIREMMADSRDHGIETWVFGLREELVKKYEKTFGPALDRCGERTRLGRFNAAVFVPYRIDVEASWERMAKASRWRMGSRAIAAFLGKAYERGPRDDERDPFSGHAARTAEDEFPVLAA